MSGDSDGGPCPHCGAQDVGGDEGCIRLFEEVIGREFSRAELFQVHRLTVDAYSMQHPDRYMKSTKSGAAHLAGMCWAIEHDGGTEVSRMLSRWLNGTPDLSTVSPPQPAHRGELTVRHVHEAPDSVQHISRVREWAESVWAAWHEHHGQGRAWVEQARD